MRDVDALEEEIIVQCSSVNSLHVTFHIIIRMKVHRERLYHVVLYFSAHASFKSVLKI